MSDSYSQSIARGTFYVLHARRFFLRACLFFLFLTHTPIVGASETIPIYFYSSETNINNFKALKMEFDRFLSEFGNYEFQPFSDRHTFEKEIRDKRNCLIILSSWHYANIHREYALKPFFVGVRDGKNVQKSLLIGSRPTELATLRSGSIASANSEQYSQSLLKRMFRMRELPSQINVLTVPKDIDALMSLGFGMAKAALTIDYSFETLKGLNPALHKKLHVLAESEESLLLILAVPEKCEGNAQPLLNIFQNMSDHPKGKKNIRMLGLDNWQSLDAPTIVKLEQ